MKLLLDTNLFLEVLLNQERNEEARSLFANLAPHEPNISDFSVHSVGLLLFRQRKFEEFRKFLRDMISRAGIRVVALSESETEKVINAAERFNLDFDDAYQYTVAAVNSLILVSFDSDFDRTELGRTRPSDVPKPES